MKRYLLIGAVGALGVACASEPPTERLVSSTAAIRTAEEIGAPQQPTAALHLQLAKEQTERARKLIADGDRDRAALVLARAEADANLAIALARTANEQADAQGAINKVYELKGSEK